MSSVKSARELSVKPARQAASSLNDRFQPLVEKGQNLWRSVAAVGLLLLGLLIASQAYLLRDARTSSQSMQRTVDAVVPAVEQAINESLERISTALANPEFIGQVSLGTDIGRERAAAVLCGLLPDAVDVTIYSASPDVLVVAGEPSLGYMRAAQLAWAQSSGERQVAATGKDDEARSLSVIQPVLHDDQMVAFAAIGLPFQTVDRAFRKAASVAGGQLALRLGPDENGSVLASRGHSTRDVVDAAQQVPDTDIWVTGTLGAHHAWMPDSVPPALLWMLALLALAGAGVVSWGDRLARLQTLARSRREPRDEPTFAEVLETGQSAEADEATAEADVRGSVQLEEIEVTVDQSIFRAYDIRGVVDTSLNAGVARLLGQAIGSEARDRDQDEIVVGRDGRHSGPMLASALIEGIRSTGVDVIDIGQAPTPLVYFACYHLNTGSGVAVTGSHNPPDYNGFKIVLGGETLAMEAIQELYSRIVEGRFHEGSGRLRSMDVADDYVDRIASDVQAQRPLKVVVDCGNGVTGEVGPRVLAEIGCEVTPLFEEIDGDFPNHHPDPSEPANLADLIAMVKHQNADLGIAFDGDGDRLGVVSREGEIIYPDRLLMLFANDVLIRDPGASIIYDVKCTGQLQPMILRHGGSPLMWKTGHSLIKAKMRETGAALAGEMSGHFFFRERWYGFDDGIYAAARLIEIVAGDLEDRSPQEIFATLPKGVSTPELKVVTAEGENHAFVDAFCRRASFEGARITTIDGLRADWPDGWGLVRASNTTPSLVLRFDADTEYALKRIQDDFRAQILAISPKLELPF